MDKAKLVREIKAAGRDLIDSGTLTQFEIECIERKLAHIHDDSTGRAIYQTVSDIEMIAGKAIARQA